MPVLSPDIQALALHRSFYGSKYNFMDNKALWFDTQVSLVSFLNVVLCITGMAETSDQKLQSELCWCIDQLQISLESGKLSERQGM